jgi:hypothetical protein
MEVKEIEVDIPQKNRLIEKIKETKEVILKNKENILLFIQLSLVGASFFGLGILYGQFQQNSIKELKISQNEQIMGNVSSFMKNIEEVNTEKPKIKKISTISSKKFLFVASKNGKAYYKTSCKNRIKNENKIYFKTEEDAKKIGLRRSKTCFK